MRDGAASGTAIAGATAGGLVVADAVALAMTGLGGWTAGAARALDTRSACTGSTATIEVSPPDDERALTRPTTAARASHPENPSQRMPREGHRRARPTRRWGRHPSITRRRGDVALMVMGEQRRLGRRGRLPHGRLAARGPPLVEALQHLLRFSVLLGRKACAGRWLIDGALKGGAAGAKRGAVRAHGKPPQVRRGRVGDAGLLPPAIVQRVVGGTGSPVHDFLGHWVPSGSRGVPERGARLYTRPPRDGSHGAVGPAEALSSARVGTGKPVASRRPCRCRPLTTRSCSRAPP
jgi:hypothetical protein